MRKRRNRLITAGMLVVALGLGTSAGCVLLGHVNGEAQLVQPRLAYADRASDMLAANDISISESQLAAVEAALERGVLPPMPVVTADYGALSERDAALIVSQSQTDWNLEGEDRKVVYLTFDDGPSSITPQVLDVLDRYDCKATFFVTDAFPQSAHYIKEAYDRGHTIGLHTASHAYGLIYSSPASYLEDLNDIALVVRDQIGYIPCFVRFPGGSANTIADGYSEGIMDTLKAEVQSRGFQYCDWNATAADSAAHSADELVEFACASEEDNIVMLLHDSVTKQSTVEALPRIIEHYQELGYSFEALDRSSFIYHAS